MLKKYLFLLACLYNFSYIHATLHNQKTPSPINGNHWSIIKNNKIITGTFIGSIIIGIVLAKKWHYSKKLQQKKNVYQQQNNNPEITEGMYKQYGEKQKKQIEELKQKKAALNIQYFFRQRSIKKSIQEDLQSYFKTYLNISNGLTVVLNKVNYYLLDFVNTSHINNKNITVYTVQTELALCFNNFLKTNNFKENILKKAQIIIYFINKASNKAIFSKEFNEKIKEAVVKKIKREKLNKEGFKDIIVNFIKKFTFNSNYPEVSEILYLAINIYKEKYQDVEEKDINEIIQTLQNQINTLLSNITDDDEIKNIISFLNNDEKLYLGTNLKEAVKNKFYMKIKGLLGNKKQHYINLSNEKIIPLIFDPNNATIFDNNFKKECINIFEKNVINFNKKKEKYYSELVKLVFQLIIIKLNKKFDDLEKFKSKLHEILKLYDNKQSKHFAIMNMLEKENNEIFTSNDTFYTQWNNFITSENKNCIIFTHNKLIIMKNIKAYSKKI